MFSDPGKIYVCMSSKWLYNYDKILTSWWSLCHYDNPKFHWKSQKFLLIVKSLINAYCHCSRDCEGVASLAGDRTTRWDVCGLQAEARWTVWMYHGAECTRYHGKCTCRDREFIPVNNFLQLWPHCFMYTYFYFSELSLHAKHPAWEYRTFT